MRKPLFELQAYCLKAIEAKISFTGGEAKAVGRVHYQFRIGGGNEWQEWSTPQADYYT